MQKSFNPSVRIKILADLAVLCGIIFVQQWPIVKGSDLLSTTNLSVIFLTLVTWFLAGRWIGLYKDFRVVKFAFEWIVFLKAFILYGLIISFIFSRFFKAHFDENVALVFHCAAIFVLLPVQKVLMRIMFKALRKSSNVQRKVLIVGAGDAGINFYDNYVKDNHWGYSLAGFVDDIHNPLLTGQYLGKTSEIDKVIATHDLDDIIVTLPINDEGHLAKIVAAGEKGGKRVKIIPSYDRFTGGRVHVGTLGSQPIITLHSLPLDSVDNKTSKRLFDILFSSLVIVLILSWLIPILSVIIKLTSKGPVFFKQERWGLNNKPIICFKFRTMVASSKDTDDRGTYQQAKMNDPRVTKVGAFLRKTSLDELPQFLNVLFGSMSTVGPRPHPVPLNMQSKDSVQRYMMRHWVKPGITGWAQVNGYRGETQKPYLMQKRVEFDLWYMENWTFWLDLQIIVQTVVNMVKREQNAY